MFKLLIHITSNEIQKIQRPKLKILLLKKSVKTVFLKKRNDLIKKSLLLILGTCMHELREYDCTIINSGNCEKNAIHFTINYLSFPSQVILRYARERAILPTLMKITYVSLFKATVEIFSRIHQQSFSLKIIYVLLTRTLPRISTVPDIILCLEQSVRNDLRFGAGIFATMESYNFAIRNFKLGRAADLYRGTEGRKKEKKEKKEKMEKESDDHSHCKSSRRKIDSTRGFDNKFVNKFRAALTYDNNTSRMCASHDNRRYCRR